MEPWAWVLIIVGVAVLAAVVAYAWMRRRTDRLRERFGPEYEQAVAERGGRRAGGSELSRRLERRDELEIRPLTHAAAERYAKGWHDAQAGFVDSPSSAVMQADRLVIALMIERGYPMEDFEHRSADISVDHPEVVSDYRAAHAISLASDEDRASTEDLREAMVHYRSLFERLLETERRMPDRQAR